MVDQFNLGAFEGKLLRNAIEEGKDRDAMLLSLGRDDFVTPAHKNIYDAISELADEGTAPDPEMINTKLENESDRDELAIIMDTHKPSSNTEKLLSIIAGFSAKHKIMLKMDKHQEDIHKMDGFAYVSGLAEIAEEVLASIPTPGARASNIPVDELMAMEFPRIKPIATSVAAFNTCTQLGLAMPYLYLINGEPGSGKTAAGIQILKDISHKYSTLFISLEMGKRLVQDRFNKIGKPKNMTINFEASELTKLEHSIRLAVKGGVKVVLIDSIMAISAKEMKGQSRMDELTLISKRLQHLAQDLDIAILLIVQAAKASQSSGGKLTTKHSGDVDYYADIAVQIVREGDSDTREFRCTKNRANGHMGKAKTEFNAREVKFPAPDDYFKEAPVVIEYEMPEDDMDAIGDMFGGSNV